MTYCWNKYKLIEKTLDEHIESEDWDHFNCITCYSYNQQLVKQDPSKKDYKKFLELNKGNIVLLPNKDNIFTVKLGIVKEDNTVEETKWTTSSSDLSIYSYLRV